MKRSCWLISLLLPLCLIGCGARKANPQKPAQISPPVIVMGLPEETIPGSTSSSERAGDTDADPGMTEPDATDSPKLFQPGDTTPTWQPELAEKYPADEDCSDALLLEKWMAVEGVTEADLDARGCRQLVLVAAQPSDGAETVTACYERTGDGFVPAAGLQRMRGHVGKNGILHDRQRNSDTSPAGLWALSIAFGNELPPEDLKLPWRQVTPNSDWVCDENSISFNTWQERGDLTLTEGWSDDVEHLEDYPKQYAYACVIEFNRPPDVIPDRGCAIFLHCADGPTGGCVGLPREDMLAALRWLDAEKHPYILITGVENENRSN